MKEQEQRIAIAEACGWHVSYDPPHYQGMHPGLHQADDTPVQLPDYLYDLNAMHEAEKGLQHYGYYHDKLAEVMGVALTSISIAGATAAQRAEAFLKTLNLWKTS